jgi:hypothetical protein
MKETKAYKAAVSLCLLSMGPWCFYFHGFWSSFVPGTERGHLGTVVLALIFGMAASALPLVPFDLLDRWRRLRRWWDHKQAREDGPDLRG